MLQGEFINKSFTNKDKLSHTFYKALKKLGEYNIQPVLEASQQMAPCQRDSSL
jgi:hypothetical protein